MLVQVVVMPSVSCKSKKIDIFSPHTYTLLYIGVWGVYVHHPYKIVFMRKPLLLFLPKRMMVLALPLMLSLCSYAATVTSQLSVNMKTDKACYVPGQTVTFVAEGNIPSSAKVRYRYGSHVLLVQDFSEVAKSKQWTWLPPSADYQGYLVELYTEGSGVENILGTIAVDVSSNWKRFPRYGFVADFDNYSSTVDKNANIKSEMAYLNRLHINGVQFQDWQWMHHRPVKLNGDGSLTQWYTDISNRWVGVEYVKNYIATQHAYGMKSIFYNLCFGAWKDAANDGVKSQWALMKKDGNGNYYQDYHGLPSSWASNIYLQVPGNGDWQQYMVERNKEVYGNFDFDGFQIDQLGYRGTVYDANHQKVDLPSGYGSFIDAMKQAHPEKSLIMNAVSGYGTEQIVNRDVDFCYNEVWGNGNGYGGAPEDQFANLYDIIATNDRLSDHQHPTVFAAYINYDKADNGGSGDHMVNTPGALLTDAVMFALGGSHLEMGDHMLTREYFPAAPLAMSDELKTALVRYYDFLTAYQNWLRGVSSKAAYSAHVSVNGNTVKAWPPQANSIVTFAKTVGNSDVVHFLNFSNTSDLSWRDLNGTRQKPTRKDNLAVTIQTNRKVFKLWVASPDSHAGAVQELSFEQIGNQLTFTLPSLEYWTMVVMEGESQVYLTGEAVKKDGYGVYDLSQAIPLNKASGSNVYKTTVYLKGNELFKFTDGRDWGYCKSYCSEYENYQFNSYIQLAHLSTFGNDYKFCVPESGYYDITINLDSMRIVVKKADPMAIEGVTADVAANKDHAPWYSLAGDRAPNPHKGIYVKKGRKVIFK